MANVGNIWASLKLNINDFNKNMADAQRKVQKFANTGAAVMTKASEKMGGFAASTALNISGNASKFSEYGKHIKQANSELNQHKVELKDVSRIVSGIIISQAFYGITRNIREANRALWEFNESLDYATVTYSALFGSPELGTGFLQVLRQHAEETIFSFEQLTDVTKKLLAYGIPYQNLMYITEGLTDLGAMSGDAAALDRISLALGQIYTRGKLSAEEMRQLANAYVPIYDIIQEKFNLTGEQMGRVGDLNLPAHEVINAIVDYANEAFGNVGDAAMLTLTGLKQKIVDSVKNMAVDMLAPVTTFYKSLLVEVNRQLQGISEAFDAGGVGGIFEYLVPDENTQQRIRQFLATVHNMLEALTRLATVAADFAGVFFNAMASAFTFIGPIITATINVLSAFFASILQNAEAVRALTGVLVAGAIAFTAFKVRALAAIAIAALTKVVYGLAAAVLFLSKALAAHPIVAAIFLLGTGLAAAAASASNADNAISKLYNTLAGYGGVGADDILQPSDGYDRAADDLDKFNNKLSATEDAMNGVGDAAGKAGEKGKKAAKGLLSFDEVYKLAENAGSGSGAGGAGAGTFGDLLGDLGSFGAGIGDMLEVPDLSDYTDRFVDQLFGDMWNSIKTIASGAGYGALIGALAGFAIGGLTTKTVKGAMAGASLGSKIGAIAGAGFAGFWTDAYKEMEDSLSKIAIGGSVGALIGGLSGFVIGAFAGKTVYAAIMGAKLGTGLGGLLGAGLGGFWATASAEMNNAITRIAVGTSSGALAGAITGFVIGAFAAPPGARLKSAMAGATLGAKIGTVLGAGLGTFWSVANSSMKEAVEKTASTMATGALVGALTGMVIGAVATRTLAGAQAGAKLGTALGSMVAASVSPVFAAAEEGISSSISNMFSGVTAASYGALIGGLSGMLVGALVGAFAGAGIGALPGAKIGAMIGSGLGALGGFVVDWLDNSGVAEAFGSWIGNIVQTFEKTLDGMFKGIRTWATNTGKAFVDWRENVVDTVVDWAKGTSESFSTWVSSTFTSFTTWVTDTEKSFDDWKTSIKKTVDTWASEVKTSFGTWIAENASSISSWSTDIQQHFTTWKTNVITTVNTWKDTVKTSFNTWKTETISTLTKWKDEAILAFATWSADIVAKFIKWSLETTTQIALWKTNTIQTFITWKEAVKTAWERIWDPDFWSSGWNLISSWFSNMLSDIGNWFTNSRRKVSNWWDDLWDLDTPSYSMPKVSANSPGAIRVGHATGGIFNREHIARFAEGNKAEAVIPLENYSAMRPFVDAISNGIIEGLAPSMLAVAGGGGGNNLPPMYVGTLIADERGLKELYKKFELYEAKELARKGLT